MPKEVTHWRIAQAVARGLTASAFAPALAAHPEACQLGAIFHDILFYLPGSGPASDLARRLHGVAGEDTFEILRLQARYAQDDPTAPRQAALVGLVAHMAADANFHPLVFHLSGHGNARASRRHRALESTLDLLDGGLAGVNNYSLAAIIRANKSALAAPCDKEMLRALFPLRGLASLISVSEPELAQALTRALSRYLLLHRLYRLTPLTRTLHALAPLLPQRLQTLEALTYAPQRLQIRQHLTQPLDYRHPVTGQAHTTTLSALHDQAVAQAVTLCQSLEPAAFGQDVPLPEPGFSIETGLVGVAMDRMQHFAPADWIA